MIESSLGIIGASARAAAVSAAACGLRPFAVDLFADTDLAALGPVRMALPYPEGIVTALRELPAGPVLYTGALENFPDLIEQIAAEREVLGNRADVLRRIRDPLVLHEILTRRGYATAGLRQHPPKIDTEGIWLAKPRRGSAGVGICSLPSEENSFDAATHYCQQFIEGTAASAVFVSAGGQATLLGATQQLIGQSWCGVSEFRYCGSVGPLPLGSKLLDVLAQLGSDLASEFELVGLFGVDFIWREDRQGRAAIVPLEVNPRYPASAELIERLTPGRNCIAAHIEACKNGQLPKVSVTASSSQYVGKAILFTDQDVLITDAFSEWTRQQNAGREGPAIADLPATGTPIRYGYPVTTVFADGNTQEQVVAQLKQQVAKVRSLLQRCELPSPEVL